MAEIAAGAALATEYAVEGGVVGYMIAQPTLPLKANFSMIANTLDDSTQRSLARSNHTLTVWESRAYIFGGTTIQGIASNDIHSIALTSSGKQEPDYRLIPALPVQDNGEVPEPRSNHTACALRGGVVIYGGYDEKNEPIEDGLWLFEPNNAAWRALPAANSTSKPGPRVDAKIFADGDNLILYGGSNKSDGKLSDVWRFKVDSGTWIQLTTAPTATPNAVFSNGQLYLVSGSNPMSSQLHHMELASPNDEYTWETFTFPTNPLIPGPRPRNQGGFLAVSTGFGRNYLAYFLGARQHPQDTIPPPIDDADDVKQWSDFWTLQIPSSSVDPKPSLSLANAIKPAKIKDAIRSAVGTDSGKYSWAEVEVTPPADLWVPVGKLHPGPRISFGCDVMEDGKSIVLWGGENAKGELVGDGWIVTLE